MPLSKIKNKRCRPSIKLDLKAHCAKDRAAPGKQKPQNIEGKK